MKRTRTQVDPLVKDLIEEEARADRTATAVDIAGKVERRLRQARIEHPVPKLRAIQVIVKAAREIPGITPNDPWSLGYECHKYHLTQPGTCWLFGKRA